MQSNTRHDGIFPNTIRNMLPSNRYVPDVHASIPVNCHSYLACLPYLNSSLHCRDIYLFLAD